MNLAIALKSVAPSDDSDNENSDWSENSSDSDSDYAGEIEQSNIEARR